MITHPLNVNHVIRWDTLLGIVLLRNIKSIRRTKSTMEIKPKLRSIELAKLLKNYARNTEKEIEYVE